MVQEEQEKPYNRIQTFIYRMNGRSTEYLLFKKTPAQSSIWTPVSGNVWREEEHDIEKSFYRILAKVTRLEKTDISEVVKRISSFEWEDVYFGQIVEHVFGIELNSNKEIKLNREHVAKKWFNYVEAYKTLKHNENKQGTYLTGLEKFNNVLIDENYETIKEFKKLVFQKN